MTPRNQQGHFLPYKFDTFIGIDPSAVRKTTEKKRKKMPTYGAAVIKYRSGEVFVIRFDQKFPEIIAQFKEVLRGRKPVCVFEHVWSMPQQGVASTFKFGHGTGGVEGIIATLEIPYILCVPRIWLKLFKMKGEPEEKKEHWKTRLWKHAKALNPTFKKLLKNYGDAFLIADYCVHLYSEIYDD